MLKYILTIVMVVLIAGCIFKEEKTGNLNIAIAWPDKQIKNLKMIPDNCSKVFISMYKYDQGYETAGSNVIEKEVVRNSLDSKTEITIENIEEGNWSVSVILKDSADNYIISVYKSIEICNGENSFEAVFGAPNVPYIYTNVGSIATTDTAVILNWQSVTANFPTGSATYDLLNSIKYYIYFGENYDLTESDILNSEEIISTQGGIYMQYTSMPAIEAGKTYYYKIKAENSEGSNESYMGEFYVKNDVPLPTPISPSGNITEGTLTKFEWSVTDDIEGDNNYYIYVVRTPYAGGSYETKNFPETGGYINTTQYTLSSSEMSWFTTGYYYEWYVEIIDKNGNTDGPIATFDILAP